LNFKEILELIDKVASSGIAAVEVETAGTKVRVEGKSAGPQIIHSYGEPGRDAPPSAPGLGGPAALGAAPPPAPPQAPTDENLHVMTSPIVGTFYRSPNPEAPVFVNVGDRVSKGQVLCIIEAMKLMNEIESDVDGRVAVIYPQNGQPVEYGEKLFGIETS
jgi:acetyl-CoA carboxylase biotin carboxyl carrier protein